MIALSSSIHKFATSLLSFTPDIEEKLIQLSKEIKGKKITPEEVLAKAPGLLSLIDNAMKYHSKQLLDKGDQIIPLKLVPAKFPGREPTVKDLVKETMNLYCAFKTQGKIVGQVSYLPCTIDKLLECFKAFSFLESKN